MLILDSVTSATVAFSTRKLRTDYSGFCLQVRESGGDTVLNIGFNEYGILDTDAIIAHCGANNGFVTIWYDQSGNSYDISQATTTKQPMIYNGSEILRDDSFFALPSPLFDGGDGLSRSSFTAAAIGALTDHSFYANVSSDGPAYNWQAVLGWDSGAQVLFDPIFFQDSELRYWDGTNGGGTGGSDLILETQHRMTSLGDDSLNTIDLRLDGVAKLTGATHTNQTIGDTLSIGASQATATGFFRGHISEIFFWHQTKHSIEEIEEIETWMSTAPEIPEIPEYSVVNGERKQFGSNVINMYPLSNNRYSPVVSFNSSDFEETSEKLILGGIPLSLSKNNNKYALMVILEPNASENISINFSYKSEFLATSKLNTKNILLIKRTSNNLITNSENIFNGIPLAITENNDLIFVEKTGTVEEEAELFWGGIPLLARRIGSNWYLVVKEVS